MLTVASLLWDANEKSYRFSRMYDETWVVKLYNGFKRNLTIPWRFVLWTDRLRDLPNEIKQEMIREDHPGYSCGIEPYRFGVPMILVGLDTVIVGNIDDLAGYTACATKIALPRDPNRPEICCNGVALIPEGHQYVYRNWRGENDMQWMRKQPHVFIDDIFQGRVVSYKGHVKKHGLGNAGIVYFHGDEKPHELDLPWIKEHW